MHKHKITARTITLDNFDIKKVNRDTIESYGFRTENSKEFTMRLLDYSKININRSLTIHKIAKITENIEIALEMEKGIFEFSLTEITKNNHLIQGVVALYNEKVNDVILNIDINSHIENKTLYPSIMGNVIQPFTVAYLSPQQLHPEKWSSILNKKKFIEDKENNMPYSDLYKCRKCGKRKCKVTELQTRCADEGTTKFITCVACSHTFTK